MEQIKTYEAEQIWADIEYAKRYYPGDTLFVKYDDIKHLIERSDNNDCTATRPTDVSPKSPEGDFVQS